MIRRQYGSAAFASRTLDVLLSAVGLFAIAPALTIAAAMIWMEDGFPIVFRQVRVGRSGRPFKLFKLRSMRNGNAGSLITARGDLRITRIGRVLRKYKLDELPQLWNVLKGDMSLVGPRPEVPQYVERRNPVWRTVLECRPGITDLATLLYRNEERLLAGQVNPEAFYRDTILPSKLALNIEYLEKRSLVSDLKLIALTSIYSIVPKEPDPETIRRIVLT